MTLTRLLLAGIFTMLVSLGAFASVDHAMFIKGPFKSGPEVTQKCLECHQKQGKDFMETAHWKWSGKPNLVKGMENSTKEYGKKNMINNFCISVEGGTNPQNQASCAGCHAGYGWKDNSFDHKNPANIDCLVCHTTDANYFAAKKRGGAGVPDPAAIESGRLDLVKSATSIGKPSMVNCGTCHFYGGGGDAVKHGDLDSSLFKADRNLDVHLGGEKGTTCITCHTSEKNHKIKGASTMMATYDGRVGCTDCHKEAHQNNPIMAKHLDAVSCQACHIPTHSRGQATKTMWDWSTAGDKTKDPDWEFDRETYYPTKGTMKWEKDVVPTYMWYSGKTKRYMKGDTFDPTKTLEMNAPDGSIADKKAKIYPFKAHVGKQPYDTKYNYLLTPHTFQGYWSHLDWQKALIEGAKGAGMEYSGKYDFASTVEYVGVNHMVAPKEKALQCADCHSPQGRLDWKALGYAADPMTGGTARNK
ncbi:tetrathionate reductase family octaheme c-type cytochrome [Chrysiogenes arsenatis]|uniref:tetrathionate reductase family octaheme c-type cytochrome n=1 Tax=Chrysiogenes arsenatis TaxID=309797 RepID=UPI00041D3D36|nr:tetrathionate reductase family octaheme c-type cytochrome [Chrysiogenes arsenatis]